MSNKVIAKLCAMLAIICIALTTVATAFAVEEIVGDTPFADPVVSSQVSSVQQSSVPVEKPIVSAPADPSSDAPVESSESSVASSKEAPSSTQTDAVSSEDIQSVASVVESSEPTESKKTESYKESSSKKTSSKKTSSKKTSSKKTSSKKTSSKSTSLKNDYGQESVSSYVESTVSYHTPSYNDGSLSENWENNDEVVVSTKEEGKELSDHVFDPKKAVAAWIWLPILIALACIGVLIYVNVYVYNRGAHSGSAFKKVANDDEDVYDESEEDTHTEEEDKEDPYSAVNFFKFDDDE